MTRIAIVLGLSAVLASTARGDPPAPKADQVLQGRVFDPDGNPVPDLPVMAVYKPSVSGFLMGIQGRSGKTGADGRFRLEGLIPGAYGVGTELVRDGVKLSAEGSVDLPQSAPLELRFVAPQRLEVLVRDTLGVPVVGADVSARLADRKAKLGGPGLESSARGNTDAHGRVLLERLDAQPYELRVGATRNSRASTSQTVTPSKALGPVAVQVEFIETFKVRARVVDERGQPVSYAVDGSGQLHTGPFEVEEDANAHPWFNFHAPGLVPVERDVQVTANVDLGTIVLRRGLELLVHVTDLKGQPVPGAAVNCREGEGATTDASGTATLVALPKLPTEVTAQLKHGAAIREAVPAGAKEVTVRLSAGASLAVSATSDSGRVSLFVISADCGGYAPLLNGKATLSQLTPGPCAIRARRGGLPHYDDIRWVNLVDGETAQLEFHEPAARHKIVVRAPTATQAVMTFGWPDARRLTAYPPGMFMDMSAVQQGYAYGRRAPDGFHFADLAPGPHTLLLSGPRGEFREVQLQVPDADATLDAP